MSVFIFTILYHWIILIYCILDEKKTYENEWRKRPWTCRSVLLTDTVAVEESSSRSQHWRMKEILKNFTKLVKQHDSPQQAAQNYFPQIVKTQLPLANDSPWAKRCHVKGHEATNLNCCFFFSEQTRFASFGWDQSYNRTNHECL